MAAVLEDIICDWHLLARLFLGLLFVAAGAVKFVYRVRFRDTLSAMEVLPPWVNRSAALILPPFECVLGLAVLAACRLEWSGPLLVALLGVFVMVLVCYRLRGGTELACGCLADFDHKTPTSRLILRNLLLLALGLPLLVPADGAITQRGLAKWLAAGLAGVGILLVWHLMARLVEVLGRLRGERRLENP
jgi:hypothetical protein